MTSKSQRPMQFRQTWRSPRGFPGVLSEVNNRPIGVRFMVTSIVFFFIGGIMALLMRIQLTVSENTFLGPQLYNELFTMHGSTMMYLFVVPFLEGLALYLIPMMIGSRDVAFPRLTAFSYWVYLFGGLIFYSSFLVGAVPDAGWFAYPTLSGPRFAGIELDFWLLGLAMVEIAGITAGIEIVVTILRFRAPGMSLNRMPVYIWTMLVAGLMIIVAFTVLVIATVMLELDRTAGTRFFSPEHGGSTLLWQHLFWFFGHPDVYIMFLPATGIVSMVIATFTRRPLVAYTLVVVAIVMTAFLSFGLWVHHMYTTGLPTLAMNFFAAASLMIGVASGIQVFAWIATIWARRKLVFSSAFLYILGFLFIFVLGGMTGVMIAIVPFDWQVHDTYFIVAHFHYVLVGGVIFPIAAAVHYWYPKMTGRMLSETLGHWSFWLIFIGFNVTFFPMHIMGLLGMPRRVYTYPSLLEVDGYNIVATIGSFVLGAGFVLAALNAVRSRRHGVPAGGDPWKGETLEWSLPSPPPPYSFRKPPFARSRHPQWDDDEDDDSPDEDESTRLARDALDAAPVDWRATLSTDPITAEPRAVQWLAGLSYLPLITALALLMACVGVLLNLYLVALFGMVLTGGLVIRWVWPGRRHVEMLRRSDIEKQSGLRVFVSGRESVAWWGMVWLIVCIATAAAALVYSYFFVKMLSDQWPQDDLSPPSVATPGMAYGLLAVSGIVQWCAARAYAAASRQLTIHLLLAAVVACGLAFVALILSSLAHVGFSHDYNAYASFFHGLNWMVSLLVIVGIALNLAVNRILVRDRIDQHGYGPLVMQLASIFWYATVSIGVAVFATVFLSPHFI